MKENFRALEVGKPFEPGKTNYPEGVKFDFTEGGLVLLLFFAGPTEEEVEAVRAGGFKIGFFDIAILDNDTFKGNIIFLVFKFGDLPWMDVPFTIHLAQCKAPAEIEEGLGYGLQVLLIDAATGVLKGIRLVGLGTEWSRNFRQAILEQEAAGFDRRAYDAEIQRTYKMYRTRELVKMVEYRNWYKIQAR